MEHAVADVGSKYGTMASGTLVSSRDPSLENGNGRQDVEAAEPEIEKEEEEEVPQMSVPMTIGLLVVVTVVSLILCWEDCP